MIRAALYRTRVVFSAATSTRAPTAGLSHFDDIPADRRTGGIMKYGHHSHWATWLMGDIQRETNRCLRQFCRSGTCSGLHSGNLRSPLAC
jgi:hypothetical protein